MDHSQPPRLSRSHQPDDDAPSLIDDVRPTPSIATTLRHHRQMPPDFHFPGHTPERSLIDDSAAVQWLRRNAVDFSNADRPHSPSGQQRRNTMAFNEFRLRGDIIGANHDHLFETLRQDQNDSDLPTCDAFKSSGMLPVDIADLAEDRKECPICFDPYHEDHIPVGLPCGHTYGKECIGHWLTLARTCPTCRKQLFRRCQRSEDVRAWIEPWLDRRVGERAPVAEEVWAPPIDLSLFYDADEPIHSTERPPTSTTIVSSPQLVGTDSSLSAGGPEPINHRRAQLIPIGDAIRLIQLRPNRRSYAGSAIDGQTADAVQSPNLTRHEPRQDSALPQRDQPHLARYYDPRPHNFTLQQPFATNSSPSDAPTHASPAQDYTRPPQSTLLPHSRNFAVRGRGGRSQDLTQPPQNTLSPGPRNSALRGRGGRRGRGAHPFQVPSRDWMRQRQLMAEPGQALTQ